MADKVEKPLVSVVVTCYNQRKWLAEAVQSVRESTYSPIEILVVDDGSYDEETKVELREIEESGIRVIHQPNQGVCHARNNGIAAANGEFVMCLDGDDKLPPRYIEKAMDVFAQHPDVDLVGSWFKMIDADGSFLPERMNIPGGAEGVELNPPAGYIGDLLMAINFLQHTYIYRKSLWLGGNRYSAILNRLTGEDYDFLVKLHAKGHRLYYVDEPSCYYRQHGISRNNHNFRRYLSKFLIIFMSFRWYIRHPRFILANLWWCRFRSLVADIPAILG